MRCFVVAGFCLFLASCSGTTNLLNFNSPDEEPVAAEAAPAAQPVAQVDTHQEFCRNVAAQDIADKGFDQATQARVAQQSFAQCLALNSR